MKPKIFLLGTISSHIPYILVSCVSTFIQFKVLSSFPSLTHRLPRHMIGISHIFFSLLFLVNSTVARKYNCMISTQIYWDLFYGSAAAAKSLQSCPTLCDPVDGSPPGSPIPRILQARTLEWVAISFSNAWKWKVKVRSLSRIWLFATPRTAAFQAPLSMGYMWQRMNKI